MNVLLVTEDATLLCSSETQSFIGLSSGWDALRREIHTRRNLSAILFAGIKRPDPLRWISNWGIYGRFFIGILSAHELTRILMSLKKSGPCYELVTHTPLWQETAPNGSARRFRIDQRAREISLNNRRMTCSPLEFRLLILFLRYPDIVFSREELRRRISGASERAKPQIIDVLVRRLRDKLELNNRAPEHIYTVRRFGYMFRYNRDIFMDSLTDQLFVSWPSAFPD